MSPVEKKLVGNTEQNLREMIAATPSCLKIVDKEGRLLAMNPQGIQLIEAPDEDLSLIHISEPTRRRGISYAVFCLKKKKKKKKL